MELLTPDTGLLFWMILSFLIVLVILARYGFPVIVKAVSKRQEFIEGSFESARKANEQLANIKIEWTNCWPENAKVRTPSEEKRLRRNNKSSTKLAKAAAEAQLQVAEATRRIGEGEGEGDARGTQRDNRPGIAIAEKVIRENRTRRGTETRHQPTDR